MTYYAHINTIDNSIGKGQVPCVGDNLVCIEITEEVYNNIDHYVYIDGEIILDPNYEDKQRFKERQRLNELFMTRSDFFDATIMAFGTDENDLLVIISNVLDSLQLDTIQKKIALNNYKNALNFYRKHTLFNLLSGIPIPISEQQSIVITSEQWDRFFDTKDYRELLPKEV